MLMFIIIIFLNILLLLHIMPTTPGYVKQSNFVTFFIVCNNYCNPHNLLWNLQINKNVNNISAQKNKLHFSESIEECFIFKQTVAKILPQGGQV